MTFGITFGEDIIVTMKNDVPNALGSVNSFVSQFRDERNVMTTQRMKKIAEESQKEVMEYLTKEDGNGRRLQEHSEATSFWITNQIYIKGVSKDLIKSLRQIKGVEFVEKEQTYQVEEPIEVSNENSTIDAVQWGINRVRNGLSDDFIGKDIIVANIDTGVRGSHRILKSSFMGEYGWYDPYKRTSSPNDQNGHGTHVMGTIVGSEGYGVAPGATWMACKGCADRSCKQSALIACGQFFLCPHKTSGSSSKNDCSKAPHVINNSWGGGQGSRWFKRVVNAWQEAGIIPVFFTRQFRSRMWHSQFSRRLLERD